MPWRATVGFDDSEAIRSISELDLPTKRPSRLHLHLDIKFFYLLDNLTKMHIHHVEGKKRRTVVRQRKNEM